jgi:hypothetical protein
MITFIKFVKVCGHVTRLSSRLTGSILSPILEERIFLNPDVKKPYLKAGANFVSVALKSGCSYWAAGKARQALSLV